MTPRCKTCGAELRPTFDDQASPASGAALARGPAVCHTETHRSVWKCPYCDGILEASRREYEKLLKTINDILNDILGQGEGGRMNEP